MRLFPRIYFRQHRQKTLPKGGWCKICKQERNETETPSPRTVLSPPVSRAALTEGLSAYLSECASEKRIANVAGFCRFCGAGVEEFDGLRETAPEIHSALCAILEDEALNSAMSASVLSIYLKMRLGYAEGKQEKPDPRASPTVTQSGQLRIIFDHDGFADGE